MMELTNAGAAALQLMRRVEELESEVSRLKEPLGQWTKEPPSKPGWYWTAEDSVVEAAEVFVSELHETLQVVMTGSRASFGIEDIPLWWSIPITEPPKPEEPK